MSLVLGCTRSSCVTCVESKYAVILLVRKEILLAIQTMAMCERRGLFDAI
jgi:hypothetical protein